MTNTTTMGNPTKEAYLYRDKYNDVKIIYSSEATAKATSKNGKYVKIIFPVAEDISIYEAEQFVKAAEALACLK